MSGEIESGARGRNFRLLACDLDGTLLFQGELTNRAIAALDAAHAAGCIVVISTGRSYGMMPRKLHTLSSVDAFINSNGASVTTGGKRFSIEAMDNETACAVLETLLGCGAVVNAFFNGDALFDRRFPSLAGHDKYALSWKELRRFIAILPHTLPAKRILKRIARKDAVVEKVGGVFKSGTDAVRTLETLQENAHITPIITTGNDVEVTARDVNKGRALSALAAYYGVSKEEILVCGDSGNDISMRDACGFFVAPNTATADVLSVADVVTKSVAEGGVAEWLLDIFGGNK